MLAAGRVLNHQFAAVVVRNGRCHQQWEKPPIPISIEDITRYKEETILELEALPGKTVQRVRDNKEGQKCEAIENQD